MLMSRTLFKCILNFYIAVDLYGSTLRQHIIKVPSIYIGVVFFFHKAISTDGLVRFIVFNTTFSNISVISWWSFLLMEETVVPGENHRPVASH